MHDIVLRLRFVWPSIFVLPREFIDEQRFEAADEIERLREIIANYERDYSAGAGMAPIRKLGETTVEERSRSTGFSQRSRGYGSEGI